MISASFALQSTPILPIKFSVNWPFDSGEDDQDSGCGGHLEYFY